MGIYRRPVYTSPRVVVEFEMDRRGMREIAHGKELRLAVKLLADKGKAYAESISPYRTGNYRRSFQVVMSRVMVAGMRRVAAKLINTDPAATAIEVGTAVREDGSGGGTPAHRVLHKTLIFLGGDPGARQTLSTPTLGTRRTMQSIPTVAEFRERQRRRRERDRRRRRRRHGVDD